MTTTVTIRVNGRYRAVVRQTKVDGTVLPEVIVQGHYEGSSNPTGEMTFNVGHPATTLFEIIEQPVSSTGEAFEQPAPAPEPEPEPAPAPLSTHDDGAKTDATADQTG